MGYITSTEKKEILPFAQGFLEHAKEDMKEIGNRFFFLGCRLYEAQIYNYVEALGYDSIEQLAETELDLGKSSTYNLINVFKRFCERDEYNNYKTWIAPKYKKYKYSQLVEMEKAYCLPANIEEKIPPETPVRIIKDFIKYLNKNPGNYKSLPEWKAEQEQTPMLPPVSSEEPKLVPMPKTDGNWGERHFNDIKEPNTEPSAPVQTFGLQDTAEVTDEQPEPKKEKPTYNFTTRAGVRTFLADYENWRKYSKSWNSVFFKNVYGYTFKNGKYIMACERTFFEGANFDEKLTIIEPVYYLSSNYGMVEISKNQFEQYCTEHKDEL